MADKPVSLNVLVTNNGPIKVTIKPWARHVFPGDDVVFTPSGKITSYTVRWKTRASPLEGRKRTLRVAAKKRKKIAVRANAIAESVYHYSVTMYFNDPDTGNERFATVDPDMIID